MTLKDKILAYIQTNDHARPYDLHNDLPFSRVAIHRNLKKLVEDGVLQKNGAGPAVFYTRIKTQPITPSDQVPPETKDFIDKDYLYITPQGMLATGFEGFLVWLRDTKQENQIVHLAQTYVTIRSNYNQYRSSQGWIDATEKLKSLFGENMALDKTLYADFYSLAQFGKTRLGSLMLYAKQSQNRDLAKKVILEIKPLIDKIVSSFEIDSVAFIPPSIPRNVQFMTQMSRLINLPLPKITLTKSRAGQVIVAQKTLEKLEQRVVNARDTIFIKDTNLAYKNVLLIDDAVGSGASLNETAKKLKAMLGPKSKIIGFAIVGSYKSFDVIREV